MSISCSDVTVRRQRHPVLNSVSLHAAPGRVHALLGRNGAGKSTLMSTILGLITPDSGEVTLGGAPLSREALRQVGAILNGPSYYGHLSARDNLRVHTALLGLPDAEADHALQRFGLDTAGRKKARSFSTGMKARLALAQAFLGNPPLLILDEPHNGLDPQGIADVRRLLRERADAGTTVLVSSHQLAEIANVADDITILADGNVTYAGPLETLAATGALEQQFFRLTTEAYQ